MAPVVDGLDYPGRVEILESDVRPNSVIFWPGVQPSYRIFFQSGVGLFDWKGVGGNWNRGTCTVHLPLQGVEWRTELIDAGPNTPVLSNTSVTVSLAAISNAGVANNAGWAADWGERGTRSHDGRRARRRGRDRGERQRRAHLEARLSGLRGGAHLGRHARPVHGISSGLEVSQGLLPVDQESDADARRLPVLRLLPEQRDPAHEVLHAGEQR